MNDIQRHVLRYAEMGIPIFPCEERGKRPATQHGLHDATTDEQQIRIWWRKNPEANIGAATGHWSDVVDFDAPEAVNDLADMGAPPGETILDGPVVITGKGYHWHCQPTGIGNRAAIGKKAIDFRGTGGYVLLPPSVHPSGAVYQWLEMGSPLHPVPEWLRLVLDPPEPERPEWTPPLTGDKNKYARAALAAECQKAAHAGEGTRNHCLNEAAFALGQLVGAGLLDETEVQRELTAAVGFVGLRGREVERTVASGINSGKLQPRNVT